MALERDLELLDDYISGRLSDTERVAFEQKLSGDPTLEQELKFQQRIADGIRQARAAELKTMLNKIPVGAAPAQVSVLAKVAGSLVITGLVATGIFLYLNREASPIAVQPVPTAPATEQAAKPGTTETTETVTPAPEDHATEASQPKHAKEQAAPATTPAGKPKIDVYDPATEQNTAETTAAPNAGITETKVAVKSSIIVETDNTNKKYTFHYQFKEGKLILYGTFEKNLYEIMEFFSDNKRTMFLFYKTNYYLLDEQGTRIKALSPIHDEALLQKLKDYRGNE